LRARRVGQTRLDHRHAFHETLHRFRLSEYAPFEEAAQILQVKPRAFVENAHGQTSQLRQRDEQIVERHFTSRAD
jgi:hypothetical protein